MARGYLNLPDLTNERFLPDPFTDNADARMYRTGDMGRWLPDGTVEFLGRNDLQIKVRGVRIEPGEIESALALHPSIKESFVMAREDQPGEKRLVAYVVPLVKGRINHSDLRRFLRRTLPEHMVPSIFVELDAIPVLPNGKKDRRALPRPGASVSGLDTEYAVPRTDMERTLSEIWASVLNVDRVGIHDNFFDLGGHSLTATRFISRIRRDHGIEISLRAVFEYPTISALAEYLHSHVISAEQIQLVPNLASMGREEMEF